MNFSQRVRALAVRLKRELFALNLAAGDPRTPWYAKAFVACVVAYALSPLDLVPDPIPILGYLDDLLLLPLAIYLASKMIPEPVLAECRQRAAVTNAKLPKSYVAATAIVLLWSVAILWLAFRLGLRRLVGD